MRCVWVIAWTQSLLKLQEQEDALQHHGNRNHSVVVAVPFLTPLTEQGRQIPCSQNGYTGVKRVLPEQECPDATLAA